MKVYASQGSKGSYIDFDNGAFVDTVEGDCNGFIDGMSIKSKSVSEWIEYANDRGFDWVDNPNLTEWSGAEVDEYTGDW